MTVVADLRIHAAEEPKPRTNGELVLYWMQTTQRVQYNFALEFAIEQANRLRLPVLVYHGLRHDYPWASDRIHTFILESVVDLYRDFEARGIQYVFYLERTGDDAEARRGAGKPSPLVELARRAALVTTDFFPTFIVPRQIKALRGKVDTPILAVDSATVVPMKHFDREHATAVGFRPRLMAALPEYLRPLKAVKPQVRRRIEVPFDPINPTPDDIPALVASCDIDHEVPPARTLRGGPAAARRRLDHFIERGLPRYEEDRGDPNEDATSMLSPYLHFGNISPHEVVLQAREAGPPAQFAKFQDELLTWREISHNFVYYNRRHRTVDSIPGWAREELRKGEADPPAGALFGRRDGAGPNRRRALECGPAGLPGGWLDAQLTAHALGQGGAAVDPERSGSVTSPGAFQQQVFARRQGSEQLRWNPLDLRQI